jgi:hypothetical protein
MHEALKSFAMEVTYYYWSVANLSPESLDSPSSSDEVSGIKQE